MSYTQPYVYGPAPAKTGSDTGAIDSQSHGTLAAIVIQPTSGSPSRTDTSYTYTEKWKGPVVVMRKLLDGSSDYESIKLKPGNELPSYSAINTAVGCVWRFSRPEPDSGQWWKITNVSLNELTPGDHAEITVTAASTNSEGPGHTGTSAEQRGNTEWTVQSNAYTVPIYVYCGPASSTVGPSDSDPANRWSIEEWQRATNNALYESYQYIGTDGEPKTLNASSQDVAKKIQHGVSEIQGYYPIIRCTQIWTGSKIPNFGEGLFEISVPSADITLSACPFDSLFDAWGFLKTADSLTYSKGDATVQRTMEWTGAKKTDYLTAGWDTDFYGTEEQRWKIPHNAFE